MNRKKMITMIILLGMVFCFQGVSYAQETGGWYYVGMDSKSLLESVTPLTSDNYAVPFYLGQIYLHEGNREAAINHWEKYLSLVPEDSKSVAIKEQLTIIKIAQASEYAKEVLKKGAQGAIKENTIAVLNFKNLGTSNFIPIIKGLTAMIITDISKVPQLKVVERVKMNALLDEMRLSQAGVVDPETASRVGKFLLAKNIVWGDLSSPKEWGDLSSPKEKDMEINSIIVDVLEQAELQRTKSEGTLDMFFDLEKQIVNWILQSMGINIDGLDPSVQKAIKKKHTTNFDAFVEFGKGLDALDNKNFAQAKQSFTQATKLDPGFDLADSLAESTPETDTVEQVAEQVVTFATEPAESLLEEAEEEVTEEKEEAEGKEETRVTEEPQEGEEPEEREEFVEITPETEMAASFETTTEVASSAGIASDISQIDLESETTERSTSYRAQGGFVGMLYTDDGRWYADIFTRGAKDLSGKTAWEAIIYRFWDIGMMAGYERTIETMEIDDRNVTSGLPNDLTYTELGYNEYLAWGWWADEDPVSDGTNTYSFDAVGYYYYGDLTTETQLTDLASQDVTATYTGGAFGTHVDNSSFMMTGDFSMDVSFMESTYDNFDWEVAGEGHSASIENESGSITFSNNIVNSSSWAFGSNGTGEYMVDGTTRSGEVYGNFYGSQAQAVGGITRFKDENVNQTIVTGMFQGAR